MALFLLCYDCFMLKSKKEIYLIRHAEKDPKEILTDKGRQDAINLSAKLPSFQKVVSSESSRTQETAKLVTGNNPKIDSRAGFYMASPEKSKKLNNIAKVKGIPFLEAVLIFDDQEVLQGVEDKATVLNNLIDQLLNDMSEGSKSIIVSHDLSISPAMKQRGIALESIDFLNGYIIDGDGEISTFRP
jgi:hypothetical protein